MAHEEQSGFTFVDKRSVTQDPTDSPTSKTSGLEPTQGTTQELEDMPQDADYADEPLSEAGHDAIPRLNVRDRLLMCIDILNQGAWISLGLISDPSTGKIEADLSQAKVAIDSVAFLTDRVESELDDETRRELRSLVRDLHLNFVRQSSH